MGKRLKGCLVRKDVKKNRMNNIDHDYDDGDADDSDVTRLAYRHDSCEAERNSREK